MLHHQCNSDEIRALSCSEGQVRYTDDLIIDGAVSLTFTELAIIVAYCWACSIVDMAVAAVVMNVSSQHGADPEGDTQPVPPPTVAVRSITKQSTRVLSSQMVEH